MTHFAPVRHPAFEDCHFYHTIDIPGHGTVFGDWDLRFNTASYVGNIALAGQSVLEIGPASGFLTFWMEKQGAQVVAVDLPADYGWDMLPIPSQKDAWLEDRKIHMQRLQNSWWFVHQANQSKAKVIYQRVDDLSSDIGPFDVSIMTAMLPHSRDPMGVILKCASLTKKRIVITDALWGGHEQLNDRHGTMRLLPSIHNPSLDLWFLMSPRIIIQILELLGFTKTTVTTHKHSFRGQIVDHFTVVADRE